jgi:heme/copper-type cytochrome/quinol oxidase subunit 2
MTTVILGLFMFVAIGLFVAMLVTACLTHRSRPQTQVPSHSLVVELAWSVVPWLILIAAVTPAVIGIVRDAQTQPVQARLLDAGEH